MFDWMKNGKVLVTGGFGFIGTHVRGTLKEHGLEVVSTMGPSETDLCDAGLAKQVILEAAPEAVIHLAAVVGGVQKNEKEPASMFYRNMLMSMNVADTCARAGIPMVFAGSPCSYPEHVSMPLSEECLWAGYPAYPNDGYGVSKLSVMTYMQMLRREIGGWRYTCLIPFNTYGPGDHLDVARSHVIPGIMVRIDEAVSEGRVVEIWGDNSTTRCFVYVRDVADAFLRAVDYVGKQPEGCIHPQLPINVGSSDEITMLELATLIAAEMGCRPNFKFVERAGGHKRRVADTRRATRELGWTATTGLVDGLCQTVKWYEAEGRKRMKGV